MATTTTHPDSFKSRATIDVGGTKYELFRLDALKGVGDVETLPFSIKVLLENLLRLEDGKNVTRATIEALAKYDPKNVGDTEISYTPARVLLQDFTGVPCVVDLASMREGLAAMGGDPKKINPLQPVDLVIDHSVQVDAFGTLRSFEENVKLEFERNGERYKFLKWGQGAFDNFRVVPPGTGIVHQVNIEYLAPVVFVRDSGGTKQAYPDTLVGTDSHTTMVNGLGVLGWGVGGIEAEAAMLGQPVAMLIPEVIGFELKGALKPGVTATDLVLTVTQMLRKKGVVGKFVEFYGAGMVSLPLADRATIANMAPEYGATMGFFPVDEKTLDYLRLTGRSADQIALVERYCKEQGLFHTSETKTPRFTDTLSLDLGDVVPSLAGPKRPQDRVALADMKRTWRRGLVGFLTKEMPAESTGALDAWLNEGGHDAITDAKAKAAITKRVSCELPRAGKFDIGHGDVVIAAITSCTNTSNPSVLIAAGLVAKKAVEKGLQVKPWVKTSLAPGSQVVTEYLKDSGLLTYLEQLHFNVVGYGCTTCIGNSGPLEDEISASIKQGDLVAVSVLSGNRNFEGRVSPDVKANYLASPPLVVAYALAGSVDRDLQSEPIGTGKDGKPVFLKDIWPTPEEVAKAVSTHVKREQFESRYADVFRGPEQWQKTEAPKGATFSWDDASTYARKAPFFEGMSKNVPPPAGDIHGARALALLGDSVTTDHISPAGNIKADSPAGKYLQSKGVAPRDFNQYGARRGNHEVMVRGTFANIRLRNQVAPGTEGGVTKHFANDTTFDGPVTSIYEASEKYIASKTPLVVIAGKEYGTGSSRDWAAKGTYLLGVKAVIAESFERIHRSNLVGMGVLPLEFTGGMNAQSLGLVGNEVFSIVGIAGGLTPGKVLTVNVSGPSGAKAFQVKARVDTPAEVEYMLHGGILQYVLRQLA
ncbi:aconitate hydratase AcnA [Sandaracinus amylolyticus]|uniref:aconitate hydratase AcnA n=1 Tax=Sandaracinus amylolyticus TaxID=927083 RepID=UPI001F02A29E|nr:aconitate hydratase AcnA [Sandaracinus amylolyticus]UJR81126.1 Aconitate hydratase AcnA [Sandaracinus amylolyticus]